MDPCNNRFGHSFDPSLGYLFGVLTARIAPIALSSFCASTGGTRDPFGAAPFLNFRRDNRPSVPAYWLWAAGSRHIWRGVSALPDSTVPAAEGTPRNGIPISYGPPPL